jgi:hypothetical protein
MDGKMLNAVKGNQILSWVTPIELVWATATVVKEAEVKIHAQAPHEKQAKRLHRNAMASALLTPSFLASKIDVDIASALSSLAETVKTERNGREVIVRAREDATWLLETAVLLACRSVSLMKEEGPLLEVRSALGVHRVDEGKRYLWEIRRPNGKSHFCTSVSQRDQLLKLEGSEIVALWSYQTHDLLHGNTLHARQLREPGCHDLPITYYHQTGPVGQILRAYNTDPRRAVAVIDLGAGTMACHGLRGQTIDFYERDRELASISFDTNEYFTFVEDAQNRGVDVNLILGDARSTFATGVVNQRLKPLRARRDKPTPKRQYGKPVKADFKYRLILVDTLGPDALPGHEATRLTRQAVQTYFDRLEQDGVVLIHISNRYFDLQPVLANVAVELGVAGYHWSDDDDASVGKVRSHWVALTRKADYMAKVLSVPRWTRDPDQLMFLGATAWPTGGSAGMQAVAGLCHAGGALADLQAWKAHKEEGLSGDPRQIRTQWRPLDTVPELRRIELEAPKEIRALKARVAELERKRNEPGIDKVKVAWLDARISTLRGATSSRERLLREAAEKIRKSARIGVWTDGSFDLLEVFKR